MSTFDDRAATWDVDPAKIQRAAVVAAAIRDRLELTGSERLLDYGAGTGLVSEALQEAVGPITLADPSTGMRDVMRSKIAAGTFTSGKRTEPRVWDLDLETAPPLEEHFDLIVTVMTLHHVGDVDVVLGRFADLLADGGHLCIVDLDEEDGSFHGADVDVHHGFDTTALAASMSVAGFTDIDVQPCHEVERPSGTFSVFLAIGRR